MKDLKWKIVLILARILLNLGKLIDGIVGVITLGYVDLNSKEWVMWKLTQMATKKAGKLLEEVTKQHEQVK